MKKTMIFAAALCVLALGAAIVSAGEGARKAAARGSLPAKLVLGTLADAYGPVGFDHAEHVGMAGGCNDCHHQHGTGDPQSCGGCHALSTSEFKHSVKVGMIRPCGECHPATVRPDRLDRPILKVAYHRACFKCHKDVGSVGKDPKGCTEMCHEKRTAREGSGDVQVR